MFRKTRIKIAKKFRIKLTQEDLRGYRNILKLLYHPKAETPLKDPDSSKYFIQVPSIHLDLIIDEEKAEIINTKQIYPLNLNDKVYERAVKRIKEEVSKQRYKLESKIKGKKEFILHKLYNQIKW
jgi:NAD dependent epimerase/dehydratase family enzyme